MLKDLFGKRDDRVKYVKDDDGNFVELTPNGVDKKKCIIVGTIGAAILIGGIVIVKAFSGSNSDDEDDVVDVPFEEVTE